MLEENGVAVLETKTDKHISISEAIRDIDRVETAITDLLQRITGDVNPKEDLANSEAPTLENILGNGGNWIRSKNQKCIDLIGEVNSILFG